jgi:hypothetical protein
LTRKPLDTSPTGKFAIKVITEEGSRRIARFAYELARKRKAKGGKGKLTCTSKYNMLRESDGLFRRVVEETAKEYPDIRYEQYIVDDFARRLVASPLEFDVVVMPNLYGDILSDAAEGTMGGLGLAPIGCHGQNYAYLESVRASAPDIAGFNIINPTATLLSAVHVSISRSAYHSEGLTDFVYADGRAFDSRSGASSGSAGQSETICSSPSDRAGGKSYPWALLRALVITTTSCPFTRTIRRSETDCCVPLRARVSRHCFSCRSNSFALTNSSVVYSSASSPTRIALS